MKNTGVKKDTGDQSNAIANHTRGNKGHSMPAVPVSQKKDIQHEQENKTGLPDNLKSGIENLSGFSMDDTRVHYNSSKPAQLNAFAYAQGTDIHVAPGQEKHLPHEAWHVVQQAQGRVKPTTQMKGAVPVNDDAGLEREADVMGANAMTTSATVGQLKSKVNTINTQGVQVAQLAGTKPNQPSIDGRYRIKLSSPREAFTYNNRAALGLDDVLPGHHRVTEKLRSHGTRKLEAVKIEGNDHWVMLKEEIDWPAAGQEVLCIDTVGWESERDKPLDERDKKCVMDIKIGTYTKSTEQYEREGAGFFMRFIKKIEHNLKDLNRDNRDTGYDIDAGDFTAFNAMNANAETHVGLHDAMDELKPKLTAIKNRMAAAPVTFVGSSLFIVFNVTTPRKSDVKLIDPDHPIVTDPTGLNMPDQLVKRANFTGSRTWEQYVAKWTGSFGTGMANFLAWFNMTANQR